jgi:hypothetical protein
MIIAYEGLTLFTLLRASCPGTTVLPPQAGLITKYSMKNGWRSFDFVIPTNECHHHW